jgi:hypothetical protein
MGHQAVLDVDATLVCRCVYRKAAAEVVKRLQQALGAGQQEQETNDLSKEVQAKR